MTKTWCVAARLYSNTNKITQNEKRNPKTKNLSKLSKEGVAFGSFCGRNKSQIFFR